LPRQALHQEDALARRGGDMLGAEMSMDEILEDHPELEREDILACLQFASKAVLGRSIPVFA
jgi:hypothetical protein